jgi:hypothetical protein
MSPHGTLLTYIDDAMTALTQGRTGSAHQQLYQLRRFVCAEVIGSPRGYTCDGCGVFHGFSIPRDAHHNGVHHTCTNCGQLNELWRDANLGAVRPLSEAGRNLIQGVFGIPEGAA